MLAVMLAHIVGSVSDQMAFFCSTMQIHVFGHPVSQFSNVYVIYLNAQLAFINGPPAINNAHPAYVPVTVASQAAPSPFLCPP